MDNKASSSSQTEAAAVPGESAVRRTTSTTSGRFRQRRQSGSERINEILETARERADNMGSDPATIRRHSSFGGPDAAPDETTGIVSRGQGSGYQTVTTRDAPGPRTSRSIYSLRSRGQIPETDEEDAEDAHTAQSEPSWWKKTASKFQSIELENKGSVARDHLALERTFLAWLRTSLAFASIGIAVTQLFRLNLSLSDKEHNHPGSNTLRQLGKPLGATFLGISILILLLGFKRYFHGQEWILKGKFPASRGTIILVALLGLAIMLVSLVLVIVIHPPEDEGDL